MLLKRKRSIDSPFNATNLNSPSHQKAPPSNTSFSPSFESRSVLNSRTLKRHRDNRPSEEMIYAQTLHKLYGAQRPRPSEAIAYESMEVEGRPGRRLEDSGQAQASGTAQKQKSLHSFWSLVNVSQHDIASDNDVLLAANGGERCEDCDAPMRPTSTEPDGDHTMDDVVMELEDQAHQGGGMCSGCGRRVCGLCSLVPRERRMCLDCVGQGREYSEDYQH